MPRRETSLPMLMLLIRAAAWLALLSIIVVSVVPGELRPHVMPDKHCEHFAAYFIAGILCAASGLRHSSMLLSGLMLTVCAATLEMVQLWISGRTSSSADFTASSFGAWMGLGLICLLKVAYDRMSAISQSE